VIESKGRGVQDTPLALFAGYDDQLTRGMTIN